MKLSYVLPLALVASANAFVPATQQRPFVRGALALSEEPSTPPPPPPGSASLVPIKEETVEFTAGLLGGAAGFFVGGPFLAAIGAAAANYASKMDGDVPEVVSAVSKSSIQVYNYLATLDSKYAVLDKAKTSLEGALDKLKSQSNVDTDAVAKVESALASTTEKISEINDEYDLVGAGVTALGVVGDLVEKAVKQAGEMNEEYKLTDKAKEALGGAVSKAKDAAGTAL
uniref:Uncharacterized protein n=1 Tax=Grammatophora oceanica TaxID=210454 RepID=A0A6U5FQI4_9STRA|mmetsp:Transcript_11041/g.16112  ORF Transcript_11041/g.16112 Transcript_11041/m.16112 type:complete len:228 (+) Transcript_11041:145-828(+)|eukprot:CAMPEP_0194026694 /NCGR_PEP_ID=MMETSP0009_2-20130614/1001_1 /TAXON_ID=210454 /ORGANISM="Grammatophora oceanica, Strain CCMP 410" /LENGTH=227 /DNA_ID=CAMNT_0038665535 /DNA_START=138 /DNA_END=821 /DNA_ORIENTATION=-